MVEETEKGRIALERLRTMRVSGKKVSVSDAQKWYKQLIKTSSFHSKKKGKIGGKTNRVRPGDFITFVYDAKGKDTLEYWDKQPMILVVDVMSDGFRGLNFHYLPAKIRITLLEALLSKQTGKDEKARVRVSYDMLRGAGKYKFFKPTFKRYLLGHVKRPMILIPESDWLFASMLPTQRFVGASRQKVYKDSLKIAKG